MRLTGKIIKWNILSNTFTVGTPMDDIDITVKDNYFRDEMIEGMKKGKPFTLEVGE